MRGSSIKKMEAMLAQPDKLYGGYLYVETGPYKPWEVATVKAAIRRGYHVESHCHGTVFYVYPKVELYSGLVEGL